MAAARKRKGSKAVAPSAVVRTAGRVCLNTKIQSTEHEGGIDGCTYGDVLMSGEVLRGGRFAIAEKLRELASAIVLTEGDPMETASIRILLRRPHGKAT